MRTSYVEVPLPSAFLPPSGTHLLPLSRLARVGHSTAPPPPPPPPPNKKQQLAPPLNYEGEASLEGKGARRVRAFTHCFLHARGGRKQIAARSRGGGWCQFMREHCQMEREREGKRAANRLNGLSDEGGMRTVIERVPPAGLLCLLLCPSEP